MDQNRESNYESIIPQRGEELLDKLNDLKHICLGMYQRVIPDNIHPHNKEEANQIVHIIASNLACESLGGPQEGDSYFFYRSFYQTSIFFLLGMCNKNDQILLSLRKIASTFTRHPAFPFESTTFYFLLDQIEIDKLNGDDRMYAELCLLHYENFKKYYADEMNIDQFIERVNNGVNKYADRYGYSCIGDEDKFSKIITLLQEACSEAYFALYQTWET